MSTHHFPTIFSSMLTISFPKKDTVFRHAMINGHGRCGRILTHTTPRVVFQPLAVMADGTSRNVRPPITSFKPSMWGDIFSKFSFDDKVQQKYSEEIETLKNEVRSMLMAATSTKLIILIDKLKRLGLAYHFETEIERKLKHVYDFAVNEEEHNDLFTTALQFRLLRQYQYHVNCNRFVKFVNKDNKLKESLISDVEGLLSLYEAAHVRIHDENVLEEAVAFTTHHLNRMLPQLEPSLKEQVQHALQYPLHRTLTIISLRSYIDIYENDDSRDELVLRLAKLNFNFMQNVFRNDLLEVATWWNKLNLASKLPYFRERLVENYMWALSYHFEPHYSLLRTMLTKYYMLLTAVDDTYDNYATLEEIELFTQALHRWNMDEIDVLPHHYFKEVYKCIMSFSKEFEAEVEKQGKSYIIPYYMEEVKRIGRGYAQEQEWIMEKQMPNFKEYMINARITSSMYVTYMLSVAMIKSGTKDTLDWVLSDSDVFIYTADAARLLDDVSSYKRESKNGTLLSPIDYYMKDTGASMQEAVFELNELIEDNWKHLNAAWINCDMVPKEISEQFLGLLRICMTLYKNGEDNFTYPEKNIAPLITALLLDSIPV